MNYLILAAGIILLTVTVADLAYTTFSSNGAGPFTNLITKTTWNTALKIAGNDGTKKFLEHVGIITIGFVIVFWFFIIWLGSSLIFCSSDTSVVHSETGRVASTAEKFYYSGYTLSTLGVGDYVASRDTWRILTVVLSLSGFMLITTAISYMLPVLSADVEKKNISSYINTLGGSPQEILINHWKDGKFHSLEEHFLRLTGYILSHNQQLLAYPILYCFHSSVTHKSATVNIGKIDEALTILQINIPEEYRPQERIISPLREAITYYLVTQKNHFVNIEEDNLQEAILPDLGSLEAHGIPVVKDEELINDKYRKLLKRRGYLSYILRNEGREFEDIYTSKSVHYPDLEL
ncbi:two pore domain potassium channel family protein [Pontibacter diazotrophicus]|uniref:Two pore domain potassium channel family protein n=1 Tax=Pontibacter diazotrophicus TaxID=1400979 RepID=A0A3D8L9V4_9BACT|nr:potassium channel family protein [Pontibacter diazotrophicus]RDV14157.1 two pore domain potassium channel family protein [Pontibacter diazotrophicus]